MVTRENSWVNVYRLHFEDDEEEDIYKNVVSKNSNTALYYAKKLMMQNPWILVDFYELSILMNMVWISKYVMKYREAGMYTFCISDVLVPYDQIIECAIAEATNISRE